MSRTIVGKLLARIQGQAKAAEAPPAAGPADQVRALGLYTRLRDATLVASQNHLSLNGQLEARRQAIVASLEADEYDLASNRLDQLDAALQMEIKAQPAAIKRLSQDLGPLKKLAQDTGATTSTSPLVERLVKAMNDGLSELESLIRARKVVEAVGRLASFKQSIDAVNEQLAKDLKAFDTGMAQLKSQLQTLTAPELAVSVKNLQDEAVAGAQALADQGDAFEALTSVRVGLQACATLSSLCAKYQQALLAAETALAVHRNDMFALDVKGIQTAWIDAAQKDAASHINNMQSATARLNKVPQLCIQARDTKSNSPFSSTDTAKVDQAMQDLVGHAQSAAFTQEIGQLCERLDRVKASMTQGLNSVVIELLRAIYISCNEVKDRADTHQHYITRRDTVVQPELSKLRTEGKPASVLAFASPIGVVEALLLKANKNADKHLYDNANEALDRIASECTRIASLKADHGRYLDLQKDLSDRIGTLSVLRGTPHEGLLNELSRQLVAATTLAEVDLKVSEAVALLNALATQVLSTEGLQSEHDKANQGAKDAKPADASKASVKASLDKLSQLLQSLKGRDGAEAAKPQVTELEKTVKQVQTSLESDQDEQPEAAQRLQDGAVLYALGVQFALQNATLESRIKADIQPWRGSEDAKHSTMAESVKAIDKALVAARKASLAQDAAQALQQLGIALDQTAQAKVLSDRLKACSSRLATLKDTTLPGLKTPAPDPADKVLKKQLKDLDDGIAETDKLIKSPDLRQALTLLDRLEPLAQRVGLRLKMAAGSIDAGEMTRQCKDLASKPGGLQALDDLVEELKRSTSTPGVMAALKARFRLDDAECIIDTTEDPAKVTQELCALYQSLTQVPDKHTRDNSSFKKIVRKSSAGSAYNRREKAIKMGEGHPDESAEYVVADAHELPDTKDECKPVADAPPVTFFDWNTWHEVGHAMDDRKSFMARRAGQAAFGGWTAHGRDVLAVAEAVADELNQTGLTPALIAAYLNDRNAVPSPKPSGWSKVEAFARTAAHGQSPWHAGALCSKSVRSGGLQAKGRIYHEAYANDWYSYDPAARQEGITGYQFRAPGEWFSELYAAFKSGKLKPAHPAMAWLSDLFA